MKFEPENMWQEMVQQYYKVKVPRNKPEGPEGEVEI
jgi:hypothetical protein